MKRAIWFVGSVLLVSASGLYAQSALVGKYTGSVTAPDPRGRDRAYGFSVEITSAEKGRLMGTMTDEASRSCSGAVPIEGTYDGDKVKFAMQKADDRVQGCTAHRFEGVAEGGKLVGKMPFRGAPRDIQLSK